MTDPRRRLTIYGNWSAYDELSDGVPLTEELAMRQFDEMLRLRSCGVTFDAYLMDAFWFASDGGYRAWRQPHWPNGPSKWLEACKTHGVIAGLWFTANTLCQLECPPAWLDSADENNWGLCCFHGGFLADYLSVLDYCYTQGVRIFKIDFADFGAAPLVVKRVMDPDETRAKNIEAFHAGLLGFRRTHPDAILMAFNGFESKEYMDRTDRPMESVIDLGWLEVFDSIYSGDPRPADVPAIPFWRSVDIYSDHTTRVLEHSGLPLSRIDNCGFMAGSTGTCYWRGKALWKGMLLLAYARGGALTVLYGDLSLLSDEDAVWIRDAQRLFESAFAEGPVESIGGVPGDGVPYGWVVGKRLCVVVNPQPVVGICPIPAGDWQVLFSDAGFRPSLADDSIALGPFQMTLLGLEGPSLGVQADCVSTVRKIVPFKVIDRSAARLVVEVDAGGLQVIVQQRRDNGALVRKYEAKKSAAEVLCISATQDGTPIPCIQPHDRVIWSGISWASADVTSQGESPIQIVVTTIDPEVANLDLQIWRNL